VEAKYFEEEAEGLNELYVKTSNDLTRYTTAEAEGRLVELPCKVDDTVRFNDREVTIKSFEIWVTYATAKDSSCGARIFTTQNTQKRFVKMDVITRESATAALAEKGETK